MSLTVPTISNRNQKIQWTGLIVIGSVIFTALFYWVNNVQYAWLSPRFETIPGQTQTGWGIIQRLWLIIPALPIVLWKPRQIGFQWGKISRHWLMLAIMLVLNVGVIIGFKLISGSTPYSGLNMLINEIVTVPLVEEIVWRGIVFMVLLALLKRTWPESTSSTLAAIISGLCFGVLHYSNASFYSPAFVLLQTLNATVWGLVYGVARAKTESIYPSILMHAAMNMAVVI